MKDFIDAHFDKMLVALMLFVVIAVLICQPWAQWAQHGFEILLGFLGGLITGRALKESTK